MATTITEESRSLESILGGREAVAEFFDSVWQKGCGVFPRPQSRRQKACSVEECDDESHQKSPSSSSLPASWRHNKKVLDNPYEELVDQGWNVLVNLLEEGERVNEVCDRQNDDNSFGNNNHPLSTGVASAAPKPPPLSSSQHKQLEPPLLFKNQNPLTLEERDMYGTSLFSAFLDGCSIVMNHADLASPWIAALCEDLQRSFPHAYANTYLTPPNSQTVPPHADDRDVFVIQIHGAKQWKVYSNIPIPYPYPHEQVGKDNLAVPQEQVLDGPVLIHKTLRPGDVLYMPRGYVHEAKSVPDQLSFHVTVALATHDWTLAGMLSSATDQVVKSVVDYRMAVPRQFGRGTWDDMENTTTPSSANDGKRVSVQDQQSLQQQIDEALNLVREKLTARAVHETLKIKYDGHNERARVGRREIMQRAQQRWQQQQSNGSSLTFVVGRMAAHHVNLQTLVRATTPEEKQQVQVQNQQQAKHPPRAAGLHVREAIADDIIGILRRLKQSSSSGDLTCRVGDLRSLLTSPSSVTRNDDAELESSNPLRVIVNPLICDLSLLCFVRLCVEFGALAICPEENEAVTMKEY